MSDLVSVDTVTAPAATAGAKIAGESFVDSGDSLTKFLSWGACMWGDKGGDYFLVNETTPLPTALYADAVALITATAAPGASDVGLVVRQAGPIDQGEPAVVADSWPVKISNGTVSATITTSGSNQCLDVNVVSGASGTSMVDDAAFTVGTTLVVPVAGTYKATRDTVNDGDAGCVAMNPKRGVYTSPETPNSDSLCDDTLDALKTVGVRSGTATPANVASSASSVTLIAANASRLAATIYNDSTQVLYVNFGASASSTAFVVKMQPDQYYELPLPAYSGAITGGWASANGFARVCEMT